MKTLDKPNAKAGTLSLVRFGAETLFHKPRYLCPHALRYTVLFEWLYKIERELTSVHSGLLL
jgi:hypothetical protein